MNIFEMAHIPLNKAIEVMQLDAGAAAIIATPERTLEVSIPVKMDDGSTKVFTGYRSQHRVMKPGSNCPAILLYSSIIQPITCALVFISGAGISFFSPISGAILSI